MTTLLEFQYYLCCDDNKMPLFGCKDKKKSSTTLHRRIEGWYSKSYRKVPTSTTAIILRKIIELDQQRAKLFIGEMSFDKMRKIVLMAYQ
jgi:hypothetical protein